jgi:hypothetical protein
MLCHSLSGGKADYPGECCQLSEQWGFEVPYHQGLIASEMIDAAL